MRLNEITKDEFVKELTNPRRAAIERDLRAYELYLTENGWDVSWYFTEDDDRDRPSYIVFAEPTDDIEDHKMALQTFWDDFVHNEQYVVGKNLNTEVVINSTGWEFQGEIVMYESLRVNR